MIAAKKDLNEVIAAAQNGDLEAQNSLAMLHELGLIPGAQLSEAMQWYGKAVKAGDPQAAIALARLHEESVPKADKKVIDALYTVAAKHGYRSPQARREEVFAKDSRPIILLVDDVETFRIITKALLEKKGYKVITAEDAYRALRYIENGNRVDLVMTDLEMPEMNGVEMLQLIRQRYLKTDLPVIFVTGSRDLELLKRAKTFGLQGWVLKPYDEALLVQAIQKALSKAPAQKAKQAS